MHQLAGAGQRIHVDPGGHMPGPVQRHHLPPQGEAI